MKEAKMNRRKGGRGSISEGEKELGWIKEIKIKKSKRHEDYNYYDF